ncbi:MAG TPA: Crp/Fnr family transcriptional regulator, partial [Blastocatellia bacterium]|nr:Crp/Fnr family transcriptional regulator [Blastocatellia bacterium]
CSRGRKNELTSDRGSLQAATIRSLAESVVFPAIDDLLPAGQTLDDFLRINRRRSRHVKAGELIFPREDGEPVLLVLVRGAAKMYYPSRSAPLFSKHLAPGDIFGDVSPFSVAMLSGDAVATEDCRVVALSASQTEELLAPAAEVLPLWYREACGRLAVFQRDCLKMLYGAFRPPLAALLMEIAGADGVIAGVTQRQLAEMLGLHRGSVARALARLKRQGLVEVKRGKITLLNVERLRLLAGTGPAQPSRTRPEGSKL